MRTKLFKSGGSWAVRIPKDWVPEEKEIELTRMGNRIILSGPSDGLRDLAQRFARDGRIDFQRPQQPATPSTRAL